MVQSGAYATVEDFAEFLDLDCSYPGDISRLNRYLELAAGKIHAALAAQDANECALAPWAMDYLKELNVLAVIAFYNCPCARIDSDMRKAAITYVTEQLSQLRSGQLSVCEGDTGNESPAIGWVQYSITDRNAVNIVLNKRSMMR